MQSRLASNNPAGVRKPSRRDGRRLAGGKARPLLPSGTPGRGTGQTNASRRDARKAILDTVPDGTSSSPTVGVGIPRTTHHRLAGHGCLASNADGPGPVSPAHLGAGRLFSAVNWLVYWIIGRLHPFLLRLFCYGYITVAIILMDIYWREPKKLWNHHPVPIISA